MGSQIRLSMQAEIFIFLKKGVEITYKMVYNGFKW